METPTDSGGAPVSATQPCAHSELQLFLPLPPQVATYPPGASFGPRQLRDFEFVWLLEGEAEYSFAFEGHSTTLRLKPGNLLLCRPGCTDGFVWDRKRHTRHGFFHFSVPHVPADWPAVAEWPVLHQGGEDTLLAPLLRYLTAWGADGEPTLRYQLCQSLLALFVSGQVQLGQAPAAHNPDAVERALAFLYAQLESDAAAPVTLEMLAAAACVSPEHLCRVFKSATGRTPLETVRLARLDRAALLLSHTNYSVAQVAALTGFASPFHFSRAFRAAYGLAPRQLQQAVARGETPPLPRLTSTGLRSGGRWLAQAPAQRQSPNSSNGAQK